MGWTVGSGSVKGWTSQNGSLNIAAEQHSLVVCWVKKEKGTEAHKGVLVQRVVDCNSDGSETQRRA